MTNNVLIAENAASENAPSNGRLTGEGPPAVVAQDIFKRFGSRDALKSVNLTIRPGEAVAVVGPNGAGKSTLISLLVGLRKPTSGKVRVFDHDPRNPEARVTMGVALQEASFNPMMTPREVIDLVRAHYPSPLLTDDVALRFGVTDFLDQLCGGLSGGQKRRLSVALALVGQPRLLVLDEPTAGLDAEARRELWRNIGRYVDDGGTVIVTTHYFEEAEALADRVVLISSGAVMYDGTVAAMKARAGLTRLRVTATTVPDIACIERSERIGGSTLLYTRSPEAAVEALVSQGLSRADIELAPITLEDACLSMTRKEPVGQ